VPKVLLIDLVGKVSVEIIVILTAANLDNSAAVILKNDLNFLAFVGIKLDEVGARG
jgi:hypothetical protein